jgi:DNA repair exonuclease SbcCD nuclease subunit
MRKQSETKHEDVIAILCSDLHLSLTPPIWRSAEPEWFEAMKRPLNEIRALQLLYTRDGESPPVICAGDIFDKWNSPPELINFAIAHLPPNLWAIPGQHDLPNHSMEFLNRSAYQTLIEARIIHNLVGFHTTLNLGSMLIIGTPYGDSIEKCPWKGTKGETHLAVAHEYHWTPGHSHLGMQHNAQLLKSTTVDKLGYDVIVLGDNHHGFIWQTSKATIFNCGTLMRRHSDERLYKPQVGLLTPTDVLPHYLDCSQDKHLDLLQGLQQEIQDFDMSKFVEELEKLGNSAIDFSAAVQQYFHNHETKKSVRQIIEQAMEERD